MFLSFYLFIHVFFLFVFFYRTTSIDRTPVSLPHGLSTPQLDKKSKEAPVKEKKGMLMFVCLFVCLFAFLYWK